MMKVRAAFEDADIPAKPQLHTRKHHHAYNGARSLPFFTWVGPLSTRTTLLSIDTAAGTTQGLEEAAAAATQQDDPDRQQDTELENEIDSQASSSPTSCLTPVSTESTEPAETVYQVKLYYPRNRACTIYRTWDDFALLRRGLCSSRYKSLPDLEDGDDEGAGICVEMHSHDSTCLHRFLKYVMERCSASQAEPAVEYFLRRRMDDCDGGGNDGGGVGFDFGDLW